MTLKDFANILFSAPGGDVKIGITKTVDAFVGDFGENPDDFEITSTLRLGVVLSPEYANAEIASICPQDKNYVRVQVVAPKEI